uniref:Carbonic anhydrase n=1 Tax=Loxodonta africana TaxID=9785 RepID=G3TMC4_LOXAF
MRVLAILLSLFLGALAQHGSEWTYSEGALDQEHWPSYYPACGGKRQSPHHPAEENGGGTTPTFDGTSPINIKSLLLRFLSNFSSHCCQIKLPSTMRLAASDDTEYIAEQMHFHWGGGSLEMSGSEHTIDGRRFLIEIHVVHYNSKYKSYNIAKDAPDGLAVIAAFCEVQDNTENTYYSELISQLQNIRHPGQSTTLAGLDIKDMLPENLHDYYTYLGSLTTPPCTENVLWFVLAEPVRLSSAQVWKLENSLFDHQNEMLHNDYRRTQPLNNRVVEANFKYFPNHYTEFKYYLRQILDVVTDLKGSTEKKKPKRKSDD